MNAGLCTASIALFTELRIVLEMISIGTLVVFFLVANALIYRRYVKTGSNQPLPTIIFLILLSLSALGFSISWKLKERWWALALFGGASLVITTIYQFWVPCVHLPSEWSVPLMPWPAAASVFLNVFLMGTLGKKSFQRFAVWSFAVTLLYVLYGVHSTYNAEERTLEESQEMPSIQQIKIES